MTREDGVKYIATISGGKDSVTMCDLLLKNGYPVDDIVFTDTLLEFDEMYEYIEKLKDYFFTRYGKVIIVLKPKDTFEHWCYGTLVGENIKRPNYIRGIPTKDGMCWWRREAKANPIERYIKNKYKAFRIVQYIGYTLGENRSIKDTEKVTFSYPLKDIFKLTEQGCKEYISKQDMENPLYKHFSRTGCACCPFQSDKSWINVWKHYPKVWSWMREVEAELQRLEDSGKNIVNKHWFIGHKTIEDMENKFKKADKQGKLFDFSDEPVKDCFCKI